MPEKKKSEGYIPKLKEELKFSVVTPIHNEAKFLYYSLPSIYQLKLDEVISQKRYSKISSSSYG